MSDKLQDNLRVFVTPVEILEVEELDIYEKMAYIVIRSHCNAREATAWPSYNTIAREGSMSRRKAIDAVNSLIDKGLVVKNEGRNQLHRSVTNNGKIRNDSNRYTLERPADLMAEGKLKSNKPRKKGSAQYAPPLVHSMHHPSAQRAPKQNQLKESNLILDREIENATAETAAASETLSLNLGDEIYESLLKYVPLYMYIADGVKASILLVDDIYIMLKDNFSMALSPEIVLIACRRYYERVCKESEDGSIIMRMKVKEPVGVFHKCYDDAIKIYKAQKGRNVAERAQIRQRV